MYVLCKYVQRDLETEYYINVLHKFRPIRGLKLPIIEMKF